MLPRTGGEPGFARVSGRRAVPAVSPAAGSPGASRCSASGGGTSGSGMGPGRGTRGRCAPQASHLPRAFGDLGGWDVFSANAAQKSSQLPPASPPTPRQSQTPRQYVGTSAAGTLLGSVWKKCARIPGSRPLRPHRPPEPHRPPATHGSVVAGLGLAVTAADGGLLFLG